MYYWKMFLWEGGRKSTEYSRYMDAPLFLEDKLDETLDSGEVILTGMPIASKSAFPPKTKFRLERYLTANFSDEPRHWDMIVEHDDVEEYAGCPELCTHRVYLIEASAVAQGMHVDNIALTYELQDVDLNYRTTKEDSGIVKVDAISAGHSSGSFRYGGRPNSAATSGNGSLLDYPAEYWNYFYTDRPSVSHYETSFRYVWSRTASIEKLIANMGSNKVNHIEFDIPILTAECGTGSSFEAVGELPTRTTVTYKQYSQRALKDTDGSYIRDNTYSSTLLASGTLVDITSFPSSGSTFKELEGRTQISGNKLNVWLTNYNGYSYGNSDSMEILAAKWLDDTAETVSISEYNAAKHYEKASFDTIIMRDEEAVYTDSNGNIYVRWYEYEIRTREAIYAAGGSEGLIHQDYTATGGWYGTASEGNRNMFLINKSKDDLKTFVSSQNAEPSVYVQASVTVSGMIRDLYGGAFLVKGVKYSCYDLLQKALLTIDTQIINNSAEGLDDLISRFPITIDNSSRNNWENRLKKAEMHETIFEQKNLWEVLIQIGYYLHAIPYLEFADDGIDRFVLRFHQLGDAQTKKDTSTKITVFNSRNLSEYFTQYDSYASNFFSPQNEVEEWVVPKTSDNSYLISNDTAELRLSHPILEIKEFDIIYENRVGNALNYIFEESIYQILSNKDPKRISPAKGNALYYKLGSNEIIGLNYVPPQKNPGTYLYSLQEICRRLFGITKAEELKYNALLFHIKYKTQDELRLSQIRPDIQNFMKNSSYEVYPHHEQYFGQQDKIIDSERFSANLFGKLIRVGNAVYQRQEYVRVVGDERESGDLVEIGGEAYYVTATENEYYPDVILQKVTYSRNFNQLSNIVTIPSEPRFYEVSERSKIRREVRIMEFLELTTAKPSGTRLTKYLNTNSWKSFLKGLIFNEQTFSLPNFAYTKFLADRRRDHRGSYGQSIGWEKLFPSGDTDDNDYNSVQPKEAQSYSECIVPLLHFPLHDGIVFEWDMEDNFKSGDFVKEIVSRNGEDEEAYQTQQSHRYVDVMGRADLFTFRLFNRSSWQQSEAKKLPQVTTAPSESGCTAYLPSAYAIGLDKDNREALSFNYQINLLHRANSEDEEDFYIFPNLFGQKESPLKMCLLSEPQSLFNENISLSDAIILVDNVSYSLVDNSSVNAIEVRIQTPAGVNLSDVKSIALYQDNSSGGRYAYVIKNVQKLPNSRKLQSWWIAPTYS